MILGIIKNQRNTFEVFRENREKDCKNSAKLYNEGEKIYLDTNLNVMSLFQGRSFCPGQSDELPSYN